MKNVFAIKDNFCNTYDDNIIVTDLTAEQVSRSYEGRIKRAVSKEDKNVNMFDNTALYQIALWDEVSGTMKGIEPVLVLDLSHVLRDAVSAYNYFVKQLDQFKKENSDGTQAV